MTILINTLNSKPITPKYTTNPDSAKAVLNSILEHSKGKLLELMYIWKNLCEPEKASREAISVENAKNWISWSLFDIVNYKDLNESEKQIIDDNFLNTEHFKSLNLSSTDSENSHLDWNFYDRNPLKLSRVPFILYFFSWLAKLIIGAWFKLNEFNNYTMSNVNGLSYWYKEGDIEKTPIIFMHGVGIGLLQYVTKINQLKKLYPDRPLIVLQLDYISMSLVYKIPSTSDHIALIDHIFSTHNLKPANWISHSYGSFIGAFTIKSRPQLINNITFIDPICFGLIFCNSLYNLLFTPVTCWTLGFIRYFGACELSFNFIIHREFNWQDRIFWPQYCSLISGKVTVYLSEFDSIINEEEVGAYIKEHFNYKNFELKSIKGTYHGGYLFNLNKMNEVLEDL